MKLTKSVGIYSLANVINASIPFLLLPVLTSKLMPSEYGYLTLVQVLIALSIPFIALNIHGLFLVKSTKLSKDEFKNFVSTVVWLPFLGFTFLEFCSLLFGGYISEQLGVSHYWLLVAPVVAFMQVTPFFVAVLFQAKQQPYQYGIYKVTWTLIIFIMALMFVLTMNLGWEGVIYAFLVANIIFTLVGFIIFYKIGLLHFHISKEFTREALFFGVPLIPYALLVAFLPMVDRFILMNAQGADFVGIYSVAYQISGAVLILMSSINQAWAPNLFSRLNMKPKENEKKEIVLLSYKIMVAMTGLYLIFIAIYPYIYSLFIDPKYFQGMELVPIIALGFLLQGFYFVVTNYVFYVKKTLYLTIIMILIFILVVAINILMVPIYGMLATAYTLVAGYFMLFILTWLTANRVYPMPWFRTLNLKK